MLGFRSPPPLPSPIFSPKSPPFLLNLHQKNPNLPSIPITLKTPQSRGAKQFRSYAENGNSDSRNGGPPPPPLGNGDNGEEEKTKNERPRLNLKWMDLLLDPDPDNLVAVGLTGLLTWASVQVLWQLFIISAAILVAALKYTIVAALLIFILITLL